MQDSPQPGDRYTASGVTVTVQWVERGMVYYLKRRADADMAAWDDYLGNFRMSISEFDAQLAAAVIDGELASLEPEPQESRA